MPSSPRAPNSSHPRACPTKSRPRAGRSSRAAPATHAPGSSHGEVVAPDAYAMSFWYAASLVVLLAEPYGVDFVRHRCRQVARELCNLLPLLEPDPDAPAAIGPGRSRRPTQP